MGEVELEEGKAGRDSLCESPARCSPPSCGRGPRSRSRTSPSDSNGCDRRPDRAPEHRVREVEEVRDPVVGRCDGLCEKVVRGRLTEGIVLNRQVRLDPIPQDVAAARIDHTPGGTGHRTDVGEAAVQDSDVRVANPARVISRPPPPPRSWVRQYRQGIKKNLSRDARPFATGSRRQ